MPEKNEQLGFGKDKIITGVRLEKVKIEKKPTPGTIRVHYDKDVLTELGKNNQIQFIPEARNGRVLWDCKSGNMLDKFRPSTCRGGSLDE